MSEVEEDDFLLMQREYQALNEKVEAYEKMIVENFTPAIACNILNWNPSTIYRLKKRSRMKKLHVLKLAS